MDNGNWENWESMIWQMAALVVLGPPFILLICYAFYRYGWPRLRERMSS